MLVFALISSALFKLSRFVTINPLGSIGRTISWIFVIISAIIGAIFLVHFLMIIAAYFLIRYVSPHRVG